MAEIRLDREFLERNGKPVGIAVAVLFAGLVFLDTVALRGENVASDRVILGTSDPSTLTLTRAGEPHLVQIDTRRRSGGKLRGRALEIVLRDPEGDVVWESSEIVSRKRRFFSFTPIESGAYRLYLEDNSLLAGTSGGSAGVAVYVNDHRLFRWFSSF